jgi:hypothetical protein
MVQQDQLWSGDWCWLHMREEPSGQFRVRMVKAPAACL